MDEGISGKNPGGKRRFLRKARQELAYAPNRKTRLFPCEDPASELVRLARSASFQELGLVPRPIPRTAKKDDRLAGKTAVQPVPALQCIEGNQRAAGDRPFEEFLFCTDIYEKGAAIAKKRHGLLWGQCFQHRKNHSLKSGERGGVQAKRQGHAMRKSKALL